MRISDWSSDVCSSDLGDALNDGELADELAGSKYDSSSSLAYDQCLQIVQLADREETLHVPQVDIATSLVNIAMALHQTKHHNSARRAYLEADRKRVV